MSKEELDAYYRHLDNIVILRDNIRTERAEGLAEGLAKGREEGLAEGREEGLVRGREEGLAKGRTEERIENARKMKMRGLDDSMISDITGLTIEEISKI